MIGEYERAFYGNQYALMAPLFEHYGIGLWMPEVGGRVDWHAEDHERTMPNGRAHHRKIPPACHLPVTPGPRVRS